MAFSLRLPVQLDNEARIRAAQVGVTLNALICFALDQYLRGGRGGGPQAGVIEAGEADIPRRVRGSYPKASSLEHAAALLHEKPEEVKKLNPGLPSTASLQGVLVVAPKPDRPKLTKHERRTQGRKKR